MSLCVYACVYVCACACVCLFAVGAEAAERVGQKGGRSAAVRSGIRKAKIMAFTNR